MDPTVPSPESSQIDIPPQTPSQGVATPFPSAPTESSSFPSAPNPTTNFPPPVQVQAPVSAPPPDMNNVTGMAQPEGPRVNSKLIIWVVLGIFLIILIGGGAYLFASGKLSGFGKTPNPTPDPELKPIATATPTPEEGAGMEDWNTFSKEGLGFTFRYPQDLEYREYQDGSHSISKWGPTQTEGTEFFDGISMSFKSGDMEGMTLEEWANKKYEELKEVFETTPPEATQIAGVLGYKMHVKGIVEADYYYVPLGTPSYLEIIDATKDPTSVGFVPIVQKILSSVKLL